MTNIISVFGGAESVTGAHKRHIGLLEELKERGYMIDLFSPINLLEQNNHFRISKYENSIVPKSIQTMLAVRNTFKKSTKQLPDAGVVLNSGFSTIFASLYLKKKLNIPLIFAVRADIYRYRHYRLSAKQKSNRSVIQSIKNKSYLFILNRLLHYIYKKSDLIVVQNQKEYEELQKIYDIDKKKIKIIPGNINFQKPESLKKGNKSKSLKSMIFVGSLIERKGIMQLLKAVKELDEQDIQISLEVLGKGPLQEDMHNFVRKNNLNNLIKLRGFVSNPLKNITKADLMVVPSLRESFPDTILESFYTGTPVIGSSVGGIPEMLEYPSLLFKPDSVKAITENIKRLMEPAEYQKVRKQCLERRQRYEFDWTGKFEEAIKNVIN